MNVWKADGSNDGVLPWGLCVGKMPATETTGLEQESSKESQERDVRAEQEAKLRMHEAETSCLVLGLSIIRVRFCSAG